MVASLIRVAVRGLLLLTLIGGSSAWAEKNAWAWPFTRIERGGAISVSKLPAVGPRRSVAKRFKAMAVIWIRADRVRCKKAVKDLIVLHQRYQKKGLAVVAVATPRHAGSERSARLAKKLKLPFPMLVDKDGEFHTAYGPKLYPSTVITNSKMELRYAYSGHRPDYSIAVERQIKAVLGLGPAPETIKDAPRAEGSKDRRKSFFEIAKRRRQRKRAKRRFEAGRQLLSADSLPMIFRQYGNWWKLLDEPANEALHAAAVAVVAGNGKKQIPALKKVVKAGGKTLFVAQLWLGRALLAAKKRGDAQKQFEKCAGKAQTLGQCDFELALLAAKKDKAKAVEHCKRGYKLAFPE